MANDAFRALVGKWATDAPEKLAAVARVAIQDLAEAVVDDTPVDTGFLAGNWQPSLADPELSTNGEYGSATGGGQGGSIGRLAVVIPEIKPGVIFYYTNVTAYARFIEYGTVHMGGRFMVTKNTANWSSLVDGAVAKLGLDQ